MTKSEKTIIVIAAIIAAAAVGAYVYAVRKTKITTICNPGEQWNPGSKRCEYPLIDDFGPANQF